MNLFASWKFWVFALCVSAANVVFGNLLSWPFVAGVWAGAFAITNEHLFKVGK